MKKLLKILSVAFPVAAVVVFVIAKAALTLYVRAVMSDAPVTDDSDLRIAEVAEEACLPPLTEITKEHAEVEKQALHERERGDLKSAFATLGDLRRESLRRRDNARTAMEFAAASAFVNSTAWCLFRLAADDRATDEMRFEAAELLRDECDERELFERVFRNDYVNSAYPLLFGKESPFGDGPCDIRDDVEQFLLHVDWLEPLVKWLMLRSVFREYAFNRAMTHRDLAAVYRAGLIEGARDLEEIAPEPEGPFEPNAGGRMMVRMVVPGFDAVRSIFRTKRFHSAAAQIALAVERYRRAYGGVRPAKLSELVPEFLPKVPRDPYDVELEIAYDAARGIVWTVGEDWEFKLPSENDPSLADPLVQRRMVRFSSRLDGQSVEFPSEGGSSENEID